MTTVTAVRETQRVLGLLLGTGLTRALLDATGEMRHQMSRVGGHIDSTYRGHPIGADELRAVSDGHSAVDESNAGPLKNAIDDSASSDTTGKFGWNQSAEPAQAADQDDSSWRRDPLTLDFKEPFEWITDAPSTRWQQREFTFTPNVIDDHAIEYLGYSHCHFLSAAIHKITAGSGRGWDIVSIDREHNGEMYSVHSAVRTPDGDLLDIFGRTDLEETKAEYWADDHRIVAVDRMPGDVVIGVDHLRGDALWWAAENPRQVVEVVSHFARQVLREHGYVDLLR